MTLGTQYQRYARPEIERSERRSGALVEAAAPVAGRFQPIEGAREN